MNYQSIISSRVTRMEESATLKMAAKARALKAQGKDIISLSLGEPDFDTPVHIKEAAKKALDDGFTKYTPVSGLKDYVDAIITKFKRDNDLTYEAKNIVVSTGAKQSLFNIFHSILNEGDEVVIFAPYWVSYDAIVKLAGGRPIIVSAGIEQDFKVTAEQVKEVITEKTKAVVFSSPCNPTGSVYSKEELTAIAEVIKEANNIVAVADEIYEFINYTDKHCSIASIDGMKERTVTVNGMAKGFAMTGWRLGYIGAPEWLAKACAKIQGQCTSGANAFAQKGAAEALLTDLKPSHDMRDAFLKRRDLVINLLSEIPGIKANRPQGAFYAFPDVSYYFGKSKNGVIIDNADDFAEYILESAFVASVSGSAFGAPNCVRFSYAASEEMLKEAMRRIKVSLEGFE